MPELWVINWTWILRPALPRIATRAVSETAVIYRLQVL